MALTLVLFPLGAAPGAILAQNRQRHRIDLVAQHDLVRYRITFSLITLSPAAMTAPTCSEGPCITAGIPDVQDSFLGGL